jgi:hypothetical protein
MRTIEFRRGALLLLGNGPVLFPERTYRAGKSN